MTALTTYDTADGRKTHDAEASALLMALPQRRIKTDKSDLPVETLVKWVLRGTMNPQPAFQRAYVWDKGRASRLIESLVLQIPIPVLYVAEEAERTYVVVDGQQRLTSIVAYITGVFPDKKPFRLTGLSVLPALRGKLFKELPKACQDVILTTLLRVIIITQDSDPEVKFEMFERLNLGALQLTDQELRNSMYHGTYNTLLHELATHPTLLKIRGATQPHKRMADCQLILRFFAMWHQTYVKYRAPMKHFLNRDMAARRNPSPRELATMRATFDHAIEMAYSVFGSHAFRRFNAGQGANPNGDWERAS